MITDTLTGISPWMWSRQPTDGWWMGGCNTRNM